MPRHGHHIARRDASGHKRVQVQCPAVSFERLLGTEVIARPVAQPLHIIVSTHEKFREAPSMHTRRGVNKLSRCESPWHGLHVHEGNARERVQDLLLACRRPIVPHRVR